MTVILPKQIDVSKLKYSEVKQMKSGAKSVYINYGNDKLTIQTPALYLPYGISPPYSEKEKKDDQPIEKVVPGSTLDVSFRGMDENEKVKQLYNKLKDIENKIVDDAFENRELWFKDDFDNNKAFCKKLFSPIIKVDKDPNTGKELGKYPPTFKAKIPFDKNEQCTMDCYDMQNEELDINEVFKKLKGAKVVMIIQLTGLWMAGGKYGCSWKVCSSKFQLSQNVKVTFIKDSDEEDVEDVEEEEEDDIVPDEVVKEVPKKEKKKVVKKEPEPEEQEQEEEEQEEEEQEEQEEEDEEEEEPVVPEPEPEPLPPPPKKKLTKKKA